MRNTILILCILALSGCTSQSKKQSDESEETAFVLDSTIRIGDAIEKAKTGSGKPHMIVLDTIKGAGVQFVIDAAPGNHSISVSAEQRDEALKALGQ